MIRTAREAPFFGLWRDPALLAAVARPHHLTTARYEPIFYRGRGSGHLDLLFESGARSCILAGIRLDAQQLVTRERSPFIWPAHIAAAIDPAELRTIESRMTPWLRSIARARPMAGESVRRFVPSQRFDVARDAGLFGAAALERTLPRLAPFVYARRFAAQAHVRIACADAALAQAVLADVAAVIEREDGGNDDAFARAWYNSPLASTRSRGAPDLVLADRLGAHESAIVLHVGTAGDAQARTVECPAAAPWDELFAFDGAVLQPVVRFTVTAPEPHVRAAAHFEPLVAAGTCSGTIVLAVSAEALRARGADLDEVESYGRRLRALGFRVNVAGRPTDPALTGADVVHIFGSPFEPHMVEFAEAALRRSVAFVFDVSPLPAEKSAFLEENFPFIYREALDAAEAERDSCAYNERRLDARGPQPPGADVFTRFEARFAALADHAAAIFALEEDVVALRLALPSEAAERVTARGVVAEPEPVAGPIGHLIPRARFAFVHGPLVPRTHCLYTAAAAERSGLPLVIAGNASDPLYLGLLRAVAPSAIVLANADARTISALYRSAAIWVDAAPRPRSAASMLRAIACGALPVLAAVSPLTRITGPQVPTFSLTSLDDCGRVMFEAMASTQSPERCRALQARLGARRDQPSAQGGALAAYRRAASPLPS